MIVQVAIHYVMKLITTRVKKLHLLNKSIDTIIKDLFVETKTMFMMFLLI